jgi:hypothetical protein
MCQRMCRSTRPRLLDKLRISAAHHRNSRARHHFDGSLRSE